MKASLTITAVILVGGAILGWNEERRLSVAREQHRELVAQAVALGIPLDPATDPSGGDTDNISSTRTVRPLRDDSAAANEARAYAGELIAFGIKLKAAQKSGDPLADEMHKDIFVHLGRLAGFSARQLATIIDEVKRNPSLDDDIRRGIVGISINLLASQNPESALIIAIEAADIYEDPDHAKGVAANALAKWAEQDPIAALDWLRRHQTTHPELDSEETRRGILKGAALQDPRLALELIDDLDLEDLRRAAVTIAKTAQSSTQRSELLENLRAKVAEDSADQELLTSALASIGGTIAHEGFDASQAWLEQSQLSPSETFGLFEGMNYRQAGADTGRWIEWVDTKVPAGPDSELIGSKVHNLVKEWTRADYAAVGTWLNQSESLDRSKPAAVHAYAATIAPFDASTAANWALTLPAGEPQDDLLKEIHRHWKNQDETAATRFAEQHGLGQ